MRMRIGDAASHSSSGQAERVDRPTNSPYPLLPCRSDVDIGPTHESLSKPGERAAENSQTAVRSPEQLLESCEASVSQSKFDEAHFKWNNTKQ